MRKQDGTTTVEFAIVGATFLMLLFGVMEVGRTLFVWNSLTEATRRGARVAIICPVNHEAIRRISVFNNADTGGDSPILHSLSPEDVLLEYLDQNGNPVADLVADYMNIEYVRVSILPSFQHQMFIPGLNMVMTPPAFETTLPRESLGVPRDGVAPTCFGS